jgi:hypothetical protein
MIDVAEFKQESRWIVASWSLRRLNGIFRRHLSDPEGEPVQVTYENLLAAFDDALTQPNWPANDKPTVFLPHSQSKLAKNTLRASAKKRKMKSGPS